MATISKSTNKSWRGEGEPLCIAGGNTDWCSHCGRATELPQKIKNGTALWPRDSTSVNIPKETQNTDSRDYVHLYVHCSIIYNSQDLEAAQVPIRWVGGGKQLWYIYTMEYYSAMKSSLDGPREHYTKWNKPVKKDKYHMISLLCGL